MAVSVSVNAVASILCAFALVVVDGFNVVPGPSSLLPGGLSSLASLSPHPKAPACRQMQRNFAVPPPRQTRGSSLLRMSQGYTVEKTADLDGGVARYKFSVQVPSELTKSSYATIMKDFKKNAKFPGFRVGTIPAFMLPKVRSFVILDCLERTLKEAVDRESLQLADPEKKPRLDDDQVAELTKAFKETEGFSFTIEGEFKPSSAATAAAAAPSASST